MNAWGKYKDDWKIDEKEEKLFDEIYNGIKLFQIVFPEFWQNALKNKNSFFKYIFVEAEKHVKLLGRGEEYLTDERCKEWWHRHCGFCWKTITTDMREECYCSENGSYWICAGCFNDFKDRFEWKAKKIQDIPAIGFPLAKLSIGGKIL